MIERITIEKGIQYHNVNFKTNLMYIMHRKFRLVDKLKCCGVCIFYRFFFGIILIFPPSQSTENNPSPTIDCCKKRSLKFSMHALQANIPQTDYNLSRVQICVQTSWQPILLWMKDRFHILGLERWEELIIPQDVCPAHFIQGLPRHKTNAAIGAWKCNFPPLFEIMTERPTGAAADQPTDWKTDRRAHGKVILSISRTSPNKAVSFHWCNANLYDTLFTIEIHRKGGDTTCMCGLSRTVYFGYYWRRWENT